jgi:ribose 1,5-bisphosphokinase
MTTRSSRPGIMVAVVGPSGAGKDSLLNLARDLFRDDPQIGFVRRVITRAVDGKTENHLSVTPEQFAFLEQDSRFAVSWTAHGLRYGIPIETVDEVASGRILLANGSRAALDRFIKVYPVVAVLEITARPDVIASRLASRGRESADQIERRLNRNAGEWIPACRHIRIDNSGRIADAADRLRCAIEALRAV